MTAQSFVAGSLATLPLWTNGGPYISRDREILAGDTLALSLAPRLLIVRDARRPPALALLPKDRRSLIRTALDLFNRGSLDVPGLGPQDFDAFAGLMWIYCGLPPALTRRWANKLPEIAEGLLEGDACGTALVSLPANTFLCLEACLAEILRAQRLWIRPSRREPFSALRLLAALIESGWPADRLAFYPCGRAGLEALVEASDRATIYGGDAIGAMAGTKVDLRGPGRAAVFVGAENDPEQAAESLLSVVAGDGGRFCTAPGTIVFDGDPLPLGRALARRLDAIRLGEPADADWPQAVDRTGGAQAQWRWLAERIGSSDQLLTDRHGMIATAAGPVPAPALIALGAQDDHPLLGLELSFPAAVVVRGDRAAFARLSSRAQFRFGLDATKGLIRSEDDLG